MTVDHKEERQELGKKNINIIDDSLTKACNY
jgi:hypothetical protein